MRLVLNSPIGFADLCKCQNVVLHAGEVQLLCIELPKEAQFWMQQGKLTIQHSDMCHRCCKPLQSSTFTILAEAQTQVKQSFTWYANWNEARSISLTVTSGWVQPMTCCKPLTKSIVPVPQTITHSAWLLACAKMSCPQTVFYTLCNSGPWRCLLKKLRSSSCHS